MTAKASSFHHNLTTEEKSTEVVEKDIKKWVESVVEFKANLEKQKKEQPLEKHLKRVKKFKIKKKPSSVTVQVGISRNPVPGPRKHFKIKKVAKNSGQTEAKTPSKKESREGVSVFDQIRESFKNSKLPQNWTSGVSSGRVVFNRIKVTTVNNSQQKVVLEKSLVITKDRNLHVLINGSEIALSNWDVQKIDTVDDIKKALKEIDSLKLCDGPSNGPKSPHCALVVNNKLKTCQACKSEITNPSSNAKLAIKKPRTTKTPGGAKPK